MFSSIKIFKSTILLFYTDIDVIEGFHAAFQQLVALLEKCLIRQARFCGKKNSRCNAYGWINFLSSAYQFQFFQSTVDVCTHQWIRTSVHFGVLASFNRQTEKNSVWRLQRIKTRAFRRINEFFQKSPLTLYNVKNHVEIFKTFYSKRIELLIDCILTTFNKVLQLQSWNFWRSPNFIFVLFFFLISNLQPFKLF